MITWPLLYKLLNNKHSMKIAKMQVFRLRREKKKKTKNCFHQEILCYWMQQWRKIKEKLYSCVR